MFEISVSTRSAYRSLGLLEKTIQPRHKHSADPSAGGEGGFLSFNLIYMHTQHAPPPEAASEKEDFFLFPMAVSFHVLPGANFSATRASLLSRFGAAAFLSAAVFAFAAAAAAGDAAAGDAAEVEVGEEASAFFFPFLPFAEP
jgi:hypothetical protein